MVWSFILSTYRSNTRAKIPTEGVTYMEDHEDLRSWAKSVLRHDLIVYGVLPDHRYEGLFAYAGPIGWSLAVVGAALAAIVIYLLGESGTVHDVLLYLGIGLLFSGFMMLLLHHILWGRHEVREIATEIRSQLQHRKAGGNGHRRS